MTKAHADEPSGLNEERPVAQAAAMAAVDALYAFVENSERASEILIAVERLVADPSVQIAHKAILAIRSPQLPEARARRARSVRR